MSKTYKKRENGGKRENTRKRRINRRKKNKANIHFQSTGFIKSFTMNNDSKKDEKDLEWNSNYNGNKANLNIMIQNPQNGKKEKFHIQMNKDEMEKLLSEPSIHSRLDKRLLQDFPMF